MNDPSICPRCGNNMEFHTAPGRCPDRDPEDLVLQSPAAHEPADARCHLCCCDMTGRAQITVRTRRVCELCAITLEVMIDLLKGDFVRSRIQAMNNLGTSIREAIAAREG